MQLARADDLPAFAAALDAALSGGEPLLALSGDPAADARVLAAARIDEPVADGVAVLVATSGSTGVPKIVEQSAAALTASARGTERALGGPGQWLLALPAQHIAGLQVVARSRLAGTDVVPMPTGAFRPAPFVDAAAAMTGPRRYVSLVPTQLRRLLDDHAGTAALAGFDAVLLGGAATPATLLHRARAAGVPVRTTYGMSETGGGCVYDGIALDGVRWRIGDDGVIRLGGATLASGYRGEPKLTRAAFAGGEFRTGDLGAVDPDGKLVVLGRADDVVITGGTNIHPAAVEAVLARSTGVRECVVGGVADPEWGQAVTAWVVADADFDVDAARAQVRAELGAAAVPRAVHQVAAIPLLPSGKPDRRALLERPTVSD
jgi:o-succinylbenzoate---CoA ligase